VLDCHTRVMTEGRWWHSGSNGRKRLRNQESSLGTQSIIQYRTMWNVVQLVTEE
jgi:hypothetical protein